MGDFDRFFYGRIRVFRLKMRIEGLAWAVWAK